MSLFLDRLNRTKLNHYKKTQPKLTWIRPSMIGGCMRRYYYILQDFPEELQLPAKSLWNFDCGTVLHELIQSYMLKMRNTKKFKVLTAKDLFAPKGTTIYDRPDAPVEVSFENHNYPIPVRGSADGVLEIDGTRYIFELKTMKERYFKSLAKGADISPGYIIQDTVYAMGLGLRNVLLVAIDKNSMEMYERAYTITEEEIETVDDRIWQLCQHVQLKDLPEKEDTFLNCWMCPYKNQCQHNCNRKEKIA